VAGRDDPDGDDADGDEPEPSVEVIAHDLANLLGVIVNYTTLLERQVTGADATADVAGIRWAAEEAMTLTRQLTERPHPSQ
jgi:signal transduction histidine kinase